MSAAGCSGDGASQPRFIFRFSDDTEIDLGETGETALENFRAQQQGILQRLLTLAATAIMKKKSND